MGKQKEIWTTVDVLEDGTWPLVEVGFIDNLAEEHNAFFLIDTGAQGNSLYANMALLLGKQCWTDEEKVTVYTFVDNKEDLDVVNFSFAFGGVQFHEEFLISTHTHQKYVEGIPIIGVLGTDFLESHELILDFSDYTLYSSNKVFAFPKKEGKDYSFSINESLDLYGMPMICLNGDEKLRAVVDTGCCGNNIASGAEENSNLSFNYQDSRSVIISDHFRNLISVKTAEVDFKLEFSLESGNHLISPFRETFNVIEREHLFQQSSCESDDIKDSVKIVALLGMPFIANQGWALDYAQKIIYKRKSAR